MPRKNPTPLSFAFGAARLGADSATTIAARSAMMASPAMQGTAKLNAEMRRMGSEKAEAAWFGMLGAQQAWGRMMLDAAFGRVRNAADVAAGLSAVAEAAIAPTRQRARANAARFSVAKKPR